MRRNAAGSRCHVLRTNPPVSATNRQPYGKEAISESLH